MSHPNDHENDRALLAQCKEAALGLGLIELSLNGGRGALLSAPALLREAAGPDVRAQGLADLEAILGRPRQSAQGDPLQPPKAPVLSVFADPKPNDRAWRSLRSQLGAAWVDALGADDAKTATVARWTADPASNKFLDVLDPFQRLRARLRVGSDALYRDPTTRSLERLLEAWAQRLEALGAMRVGLSPAVEEPWSFRDGELLAGLQRAQMALAPALPSSAKPLRI